MFGKFPDIPPLNDWSLPVALPSVTNDAWQADDSLKKQFGVELAKLPGNAFGAACKVFDDTSRALWASQNWLTDPVAIAARDAYTKTVETEFKFLDKSQFSVKVLDLADNIYVDAKDRVAALKLYAEIQGWVGKIAIDASNNTTNIENNELTIKLVRADPPKEQPKIINNLPDDNEDTLLEDDEEIKLKLVSAR